MEVGTWTRARARATDAAKKDCTRCAGGRDPARHTVHLSFAPRPPLDAHAEDMERSAFAWRPCAATGVRRMRNVCAL